MAANTTRYNIIITENPKQGVMYHPYTVEVRGATVIEEWSGPKLAPLLKKAMDVIKAVQCNG